MENPTSAVVVLNEECATFLSDMLFGGGYGRPQRDTSIHVSRLAAYDPAVLVMDFANLANDPLETIRQLRFVLPTATIAVYSEAVDGWAARCHLAGATCMLLRGADSGRLQRGIGFAQRVGCYTDRGFMGNA